MIELETIMFYDTLGKITFVLIIALALLFMLSLVLGLILVKKQKVLLPKILLFTIDNFYFHLKKVARIFGVRETLIDQIGIEVRNTLTLDGFTSIDPKDRILVVPQCLRHPKCPARLDSSKGILCKECGLCVIKEIKNEAERLGYRFFAVPGGRFVERIVRTVKPRAALGVACYKDLNIAMHELGRHKFVVQGVPLVKDGCVGTKVNVRELLERMKLGVEETSKISSPCIEGKKNLI